jgi:hypothetical protein
MAVLFKPQEENWMVPLMQLMALTFPSVLRVIVSGVAAAAVLDMIEFHREARRCLEKEKEISKAPPKPRKKRVTKRK